MVNRPLAGKGLTSYRYVQPHGYIMIGARDALDARNEAQRSLTAGTARLEQLQVWNGREYVPVEVKALSNAVAFFQYRADALDFANRHGGRVSKAKGDHAGEWMVS